MSKKHIRVPVHSFLRALLALALLLGLVPAQAVAHAKPRAAVQTCDEAGLDAALAAGGTNTFSCVGSTTIIVSATKTISVSGTILDGGGLLTISGGGVRRVFTVNSGVTATLQNLTIANGLCSGCNGGGVYYSTNSGTLTITNVTFSGNKAQNTTGGVGGGGSGGAIYHSSGTLVVSNSTFSGNTVETIGNNSPNIASGAAITNDGIGTLTVTDSTFSNNVASGSTDGSGNNAQIAGGAIASFNQATLTVTNSTFTGNRAEVTALNSADGFAVGGAILAGGTVKIANSTFYANTAKGTLPGTGTVSALGGAIDNGGAFDSMTVANSTLSGNAAIVDQQSIFGFFAKKGGGIYNSSNSSNLTLYNTIIANSTDGGDCVNESTIVDEKNNLIEDTGADACGLTDGTNGDIIGFDPNLDSLANNGGPTQTMALLSGSLAIDAGDGTTCAASPVNGVDQRGVARPQGAACDIGAFEVDEEGPTVTVEQAAGQADPTGASPINFTVTFSEKAVGFETGDVTLGGTAGATTDVVSETAPNDGTTYNVAVSGMSGGGTVTASVAAGVATDISANLNLASTSTDNEVTYDPVAPQVVSLSLLSSYTEPGPGFFTVTFSKEMNNPAGNTDADDVTNPDNYLLVEAGVNGIFETVSCLGGLATDDTQVAVTSVSYDNNTFTSTVTLASPLSAGDYRLFLCGTTSLVDLSGNPLGGGADFIFDFVVNAPGGGAGAGAATTLPQTGFAPGRVTLLPSQPSNLAYENTDFMLEIPSLAIETSIVGVLQSEGTWDVTWLGQNAGWLQGSAFPTWAGNTVITGHVWDAENTPGIFAAIKDLSYGDQVLIHAWEQVYTYEVRESSLVTSRNVSSVFQHEEYDWLTLLSCEFYNPLNGNYVFRRVVRAVLVDVSFD
ncbi:MAG: sortase [Anaerolineales bacterium]